MLFASVSFHGILILLLLLVIKTHPFADGSYGPAGEQTISVTWIPTDSSRSSHRFDTTVSNLDAMELLPESSSPARSHKVEVTSSLLTVAQTDPQAVFNYETSDSESLVARTAELRDSSADHDRSSAAAAVTSSSQNPEEIEPHRPGTTGSLNPGGPHAGGHSKGGVGETSFFGISTQSRRIVYVIDASESMRQHNAMEIARRQLWNSLKDLPPTSQFQIVFFNLSNHILNRQGERQGLLPATSLNLRRAKQFITGIQPESGTDRFSALMQAMSLQPDVIFLLTDADGTELSAEELREIQRSTNRKTLIHVVEFGVGADLSRDSFLKKLTRQNHGTHCYVDLTRSE